MKHEKQPLPLTCLVRYSLKHCCINAYPWAYPWFSSKVPNFYPVGSFVFDHLSSVVIYQEGLVFPFCLMGSNHWKTTATTTKTNQ